MANKETTSFISTDAKVLIKNWQVLYKLIEAHTQTIEQHNNTESGSFSNLLSERQLRDALSGPYQRFFKQKLTAYATIGKFLLEMNMQQDDSLKAHAREHEKVNPKLAQLLEKYSISDINSMRSDIDKLTEDHNEQWETQLSEWNQQLLATMTSNKIPLTDIEIDAFKEKEPLSALIRRYTDLNIDLPKLDYTDFNFEQYLKLKLELAIRSSLHRRHEAHESTNINRLIKRFKNKFAKIKQQENELLKKQQVETREIVQTISP